MTYTQRPIGRASLLLAVLVLALTACGTPATIGQPGAQDLVA